MRSIYRQIEGRLPKGVVLAPINLLDVQIIYRHIEGHLPKEMVLTPINLLDDWGIDPMAW